MRRLTIAALAAFCLLAGCRQPASAPAIPRDAEIEARVEKVLRGMTLEEKAGQMVQLTVLTVEDVNHEALDPAKLDVILGKYGNDAARVRALQAAGFDARLVQDLVNEILK